LESFFKLERPEKVFDIINGFGPSGEERIPLQESMGRVLSQDLISPENLPRFFRSTVDGYAVRAKNTFGASESLPALLEVTGEVTMGKAPGEAVGDGKAFKISTGGMLPEGADGVVMVEYCHLLDEKTLEVSRTISPLENIIQPGDDLKEGAIVVRKGHRLRPQDIGVMAGLGQIEIPVYRRPTVAIISTGDEIVPIEKQPLPGQVRDINGSSLVAFCRLVGSEPLYVGLCRDDFDPLKEMVEGALNQADTVWISGGSSVGTRDLTLKVFESLRDFELFVYGISISPGKPTIIGRSGFRPVIGLPGHVASALIVAEVFLTRLIARLSGITDLSGPFQTLIEAEMGRNIESASGREDYIRVRLVHRGDTLIAEPVFGKSGLISTLVESDGLVRIGMLTEGLYKGQKVKVMVFDAINRGSW